MKIVEEKLEIMMKIAEKSLFIPYIWGGQSPLIGFDCSGLVIECLRSIGVISLKADFTANKLYEMFSKYVKTQEPERGDLIFWFIDSKRDEFRVRHVEICVGANLSIGASGGNSQTRSLSNATLHEAYVKIRPIKTRGDNFIIIDTPQIIRNIYNVK